MKVRGFDKYEVHSDGTVVSYMKYKSGYRLKPIPNSKGALYVVLYDKSGSRHQFRLNRLVADHFIPNPNRLPNVVHVNGDLSDNSATNLEWKDTIDTHLTARNHGKYTQYVIGSRELNRILKLYRSGVHNTELAKIYGVNRATIKYWLDKELAKENQ